MSILARFSPSASVEQYEAVTGRLKSDGVFPPEGLDYHAAFLVGGGIRVSEIWDSREQLDAWVQRLMPVLTENGVNLEGEPEIYEIHNIVKR